MDKNSILGIIQKINGLKYSFYLNSLRVKKNKAFLIGKSSYEKLLFVIEDFKDLEQFEGKVIDNVQIGKKRNIIKICPLTYMNLKILRDFFTDAGPVVCNKRASFGTGDRLGMVTAAHIKAFSDVDIFPVLIQQSARELNRTGKNWCDVMATGLWGYFESGSDQGFGADADHVKNKEDLKDAVDAGFNMFTVDPSDNVMCIQNLSNEKIKSLYNHIDDRTLIEKTYLGKIINLGKKKYLIDKDILAVMAVKYERSINNVAELHSFLNSYTNRPFDFEVSMDETETEVTPLEHYFISSELMRLGVRFNNLALRFPGKWEKAIDFKGDLNDLENQLSEHAKILEIFGGYKLSLHSGSEKLSTYPVFARICEGKFHIKTAGTSYLEAIRVISELDPDLFRKIYTISLESFEKDRDSYHLTTDTSKLSDIGKTDDKKLKNYLDIHESRQMLHVTFGTILTYTELKKRLLDVLFKNEELHYKYVEDNIKKHLELLA